MNLKTSKIVSAFAVGLQVITVIATYLIYANQGTVKMIFSASQELLKVNSVPVSYFIMNACPAVLYFLFVGLLVSAENNKNNTKVGAIIFFAIACLMKIVLGLLPIAENFRIAMLSVSELASLSTLNNAISMVTDPISLLAFGIFSLAAGMNLMEGRKESGRSQIL